jgi:hypothetical protein
VSKTGLWQLANAYVSSMWTLARLPARNRSAAGPSFRFIKDNVNETITGLRQGRVLTVRSSRDAVHYHTLRLGLAHALVLALIAWLLWVSRSVCEHVAAQQAVLCVSISASCGVISVIRAVEHPVVRSLLSIQHTFRLLSSFLTVSLVSTPPQTHYISSDQPPD